LNFEFFLLQTITLNEATLNRLKSVSGILQKGQNAHQSLKLVYILIALFSVIAIIAVIELFFWNRQVSSEDNETFYSVFLIV
jgi:hypothetical protein